MKLKDFVPVYEESEIVKYFGKEDWDKYKGEDCAVCSKAFKKEPNENDKERKDETHDEQVVSDIKGNLYHLKCFNKRFNSYDSLHLRKKKPAENLEGGSDLPYHYGEK